MTVLGGLGDVLPSVLAALGVPPDQAGGGAGPARKVLDLPPARNAVVVLVDGLGDRLLERRGGHAPFLRHLRADSPASATLTCGFPSTTATSMGIFGTGELPGTHGLVGLDGNRCPRSSSGPNGPVSTWSGSAPATSTGPG
ncbi:MAG: alkaline phosphatase family protein [Kineosporiaceae bacterium]